jgi:predicted DNA binding protein
MTLKIIRFSESRQFAEKSGLTDLLVDFDQVEILNVYQYDTNSIFSLDRFRFKPNRIGDLDKIFRQKLNAEYYEVLSQQNDEILCILKQRRGTGFFNILGQGPAALLCPIIVREDVVQLQILAEEHYLTGIFENLSKFSDAWKVTHISNVEGMKDLDQFGHFKTPTPNFTAKQREIATYAAQHGYFKSPKQISGQSIADQFGITESAVNMHLKNAENLAMTFFFGEV